MPTTNAIGGSTPTFAQVLIAQGASSAVCRRRPGASILDATVYALGRQSTIDSVSFDVSLGQVSQDQGRGQASYVNKPPRQHPRIHPDFRRKTARCERVGSPHCPRRALTMSWTVAISISRALYELRSSQGVFCDSGQEGISISSVAIRTKSTSPPVCNATKRSCLEHVLFLAGISATATSHSLLRRKPRQAIRVLDQRLRTCPR